MQRDYSVMITARDSLDSHFWVSGKMFRIQHRAVRLTFLLLGPPGIVVDGWDLAQRFIVASSRAKHLLEWVTAADVKSRAGQTALFYAFDVAGGSAFTAGSFLIWLVHSHRAARRDPSCLRG